MYCENCQFEIEDHQETQCPLCGGPLVKSSEAPGGSAGRISLDANDPTQGAFVLEEDDDEALEQQNIAAQEPMSYDRPEMSYAEPAAPAQAEPVYADSTTEMLDQALEEFDPMVDEHFNKKKKSKSRIVLLLIVFIVCLLGLAGSYYFFMMQEPEAPAPAVPVRVAQPKKPVVPAEKPAAPAAAPEQQPAPAPVAAPKTPEPVKPAQEAKKPEAPAAAPEQQPVPAPVAAPKTPEPVKPAQEAKKPEAPAVAPVHQAQEKPLEPVLTAKEPGKAAQTAKKTPAPAPDKAQPRAAEETAAVKAQRPVQEAVPPPVAQAPAAKNGKPVFSVMADSCRIQSNADKEMQRLRKLGYDARIMQIDLGRKGVFYRVLVGAWPNRAEAEQMVNELRSKLGKRDASILPVMQ